MFRHPIPLNTLCHHQANIAYDKLAVISDHIDELANVADCILDLKEYLFHILKLYVTLSKDETITGKKKFTKPITTTKVNLYNEVDETDNIAFIETGWDNCIPYVDLHVDREDSQTHDQYKANIRLLLDPCDNYKAKFLIPYTDGEEDYSAVCVKYLKEQWQILKNLIDTLTDRVGTTEGAITAIETLDYPVDGSTGLVTSNGIYDYGQTIKGEVLNAIGTALNNLSDANTTYSFALNGNNLVITPSSGNAQTVDLSSLVSNGSGGGSNDSYIFAYPSGTVKDGDMPTPEVINAWDIITGDHLASAVEVSTFGGNGNHPDIVTYTIDQNSSLNSNSFVAGYWQNQAVYTPTNLSSSDSYRCIVAPEITQGSGAGGAGDTRPWVRVKAGVFQKLLTGGSGSGPTIQAVWISTSQSPHSTYSSTVGNTYSGDSLYLPNGYFPNGTCIGEGGAEYICITASSYQINDIDSSGVHYGSIVMGTFRKVV